MAKKKEYQIKILGQIVPVNKEVYLTYHRMKRREKYLEERDAVNVLLQCLRYRWDQG